MSNKLILCLSIATPGFPQFYYILYGVTFARRCFRDEKERSGDDIDSYFWGFSL